MKIIVDTIGADKGPAEMIKGAVEALADSSHTMMLAGDRELIENELKAYTFDPARIEILHAPDEVTNEDVPTTVIREKKNSSMVMALNRAKTDPEVGGVVSAGSTGALLTGAIFLIGRIRGVARPMLAPLIPSMKNHPFTVVDSGANMDCKPEYLVQFAIMGSHYLRQMCGIESPRVALVSVGAEDKKGDARSKEAFAMLKALPEGTINFVGNMEARYAMSGDYEVLVADGFVGNVMIKTLEGTAMYVLKSLKEEIMASNAAKFGSLFLKGTFKRLRGRMDYSVLGGAALLGVEKPVVKTHGSSKAATVRASVNQVIRMAEQDVIQKIKDSLGVKPSIDA